MKCSLCKEHGHPGKISKSWVQGTQNTKIHTVKFHEKGLAHIDAEKSQKITKNPDQAENFVAIRSYLWPTWHTIDPVFVMPIVLQNGIGHLEIIICELDRAKGLDTGYSYIESDSESSEPEIDNEQIELEIEKEREIVLDN
ncbi:LOW QUALITY PROTEIN: hypothetical protein KUTeg_023467 [Tegillarca granosa]|uniref:Uncharacterized protein n=1 Tax=Tegillarca granosa TaxID=220873 RepID=A0ABQ9E2A0_TEGGR|nr:LOW QUALITY PROTEIN: hypothetical protein KUTeg_023467 [Tegillarca granosa]